MMYTFSRKNCKTSNLSKPKSYDLNLHIRINYVCLLVTMEMDINYLFMFWTKKC